MGKIIVSLTMSLDGFIAGPDDGPGQPLGKGGDRLFDWMYAGPESNRVNEWLAPPDASKSVIDGWESGCGAIVSGRRTFDIARGWKEGHPIQQLLRAGKLDEIEVSVVPYLLGAGSGCSTTSARIRSSWSRPGSSSPLA